MSENRNPKVAAKAFFRQGKNLKESFMEAGYCEASSETRAEAASKTRSTASVSVLNDDW